MQKKIFVTQLFCILLTFFLFWGNTAGNLQAAEEELSNSLEDYVVFKAKDGEINYRIADFAPIEQWFITQAEGKSDKEIEALYDKLPLIGDLDNFNETPPEKKTEAVLEISKTILENGEKYKKAYRLFSDEAEATLVTLFSFYSQLFPDKEMDVIMVINPFFKNGGMGSMLTQANGQEMGRLEIGVARMSPLELTTDYVPVIIAHEFTHIIHQYFGAKGLLDYDYTELTEDLVLLTEGVASYYSAVIMDQIDNNDVIFFGNEYASGPINDDGFVKIVAKQYLDEAAGKMIEKKLHAAWFGSRVEERAVKEYPAIGYYLGYHAVKLLIDTNTFTLKTLMESNVRGSVQQEIVQAVEILSNQ